MKKLLLSLGLMAFVLSAEAQTAAPIYRFIPLLSGFNVLVPSNAPAGLGVTNTLYTNPQGQVLFSLTNNVINGTLFTNTTSADAFKLVALSADNNGDINANASLVVYMGATNMIPFVTTNSQGQYIIPPAGYTNSQIGTTGVAAWPLASQGGGFPNWQYPATTNYYLPLANMTSQVPTTNQLYISLYKVSTTKFQGGDVSSDLQGNNLMIETTPSFQCVVPGTTNAPMGYCWSTNLPATFLQGARFVVASVSMTNGLNQYAPAQSAGTNSFTPLINQLGIVQPQP